MRFLINVMHVLVYKLTCGCLFYLFVHVSAAVKLRIGTTRQIRWLKGGFNKRNKWEPRKFARCFLRRKQFFSEHNFGREYFGDGPFLVVRRFIKHLFEAA